MPSIPNSRLRSAVSRLAHVRPQSRDRRNQSSSRSEQGLTLIECLVAMIVITVTVVAITPPILLATATRVQSRRAEQATAVAQGEIDRVRLLVERSDKEVKYTDKNLPASAGTSINNVPAATGSAASGPLASSAACAGASSRYPLIAPAQLPFTDLVRIDIDGDCKPEYVMQIFRAEDQTPPGATDLTPFAFKVGVRVYSYFDGETLPALDTVRSSSVSTTGARDNSVGGGKRKPLAVLYTTIARSGSSSTLCQVRQQINASRCLRYCAPSPSPLPTAYSLNRS